MVKQSGFSLIELIVAIAILATITVAANSSLVSVLKTKDIVIKSNLEFRAIQKAISAIDRDFFQIAPRYIRYGSSKTKPALIYRDNRIEFTRSGKANLLQLQRSDFFRVSFYLEDDRLIRESWPVLDRSETDEPERIVILKKVKTFEIEFLDRYMHSWTKRWPVDKRTKKNELPKFIKVNIELEDFGTITRMLPGVG